MWKYRGIYELMENHQKPGLFEVALLNVEELVFPHVGRETAPAVDIYLSPEAYQIVADHTDSDLEREVIGLLLGKVREKVNRLEVTVSQALTGRETISTSVSVQLSYESWQHFYAEKAKLYPNLATIGWYHSHPGFGTFLSSMDEFIHKNFFGKPWQVALVVDPVHQQWDFFQVKNDQAIRLERFNDLGWQTPQLTRGQPEIQDKA